MSLVNVIEQTVDIPVRAGGIVGNEGDQGFLRGESSSPSAEQTVDIPVFRRVFSGGLQGENPGQGSTAFGRAEHFVPGGSLHGLRPDQGSTAFLGPEHVHHQDFSRGPGSTVFGRDEDPGGGGQNCVGRQARRDVDSSVIAKGPFSKLWMRKDGVDQLVQGFRYSLMDALFRQCCSHVGLQAEQIRFICGKLLSPDDTPAQAGLEDDHIVDVVVSRGRRGGGCGWRRTSTRCLHGQ